MSELRKLLTEEAEKKLCSVLDRVISMAGSVGSEVGLLGRDILKLAAGKKVATLRKKCIKHMVDTAEVEIASARFGTQADIEDDTEPGGMREHALNEKPGQKKKSKKPKPVGMVDTGQSA